MIFHLSEHRSPELEEQLGIEPDTSRYPGLYLYKHFPNRRSLEVEDTYSNHSDDGQWIMIRQNGWPRHFIRAQQTPLVINNWDTALPACLDVDVNVNTLEIEPAETISIHDLILASERKLTLEEAAYRAVDIIQRSLVADLRRSIRLGDKPAKLYTTGGLDTAVLEAVIRCTDYANRYVEIDRSLHGTKCDPRWASRGAERRFLLPHHPDLKQIPPHRGVLITGHWGGVALGRWPAIVRGYAKLDGWDYDQELERHRGSYLYNFLKSPTHRAADPNIYPGIDADTPEEVLDRASEILYHSHEVRNFDDTVLVTPFRHADLHQVVHQLKPELLLDNAFTSSLHMAIIEVCDPSVFDTVDRIKFKSPFG